ncbi:MAG: HEAT repeat domain-containing protein [Thermodesulfovibrionales bacterium]|nr:HEAT repeat domain-containing protein [Thermodesulfovibrionales bacterium]
MLKEEIEKQLQSIDTDKRRAAVLMLKAGPPGIARADVIALFVKAMQDSGWRVRKTAQEMLFEEYPIDAYIDGLISLLYMEDNAGARNSAIETLTRLGKKSTPYLIEAFKTPNADVRKFIIDVLGQFRDKNALQLMLDALKDEDENVRASAVEHLGVIGEPSVVDALIAILDEGDLWTAYPAADALGRIGDGRALPALIRALLRKPLREPALKAIGKLGDEECLKEVAPFINDKSRVVQEEAIKAVERLYHKGVKEEVVAGHLRSFFGDGAIHLLLEHAWSTKPEVRVSAILLLGLLKDERALDPLLDLSSEAEFADDVKRALVFIGRGKPESLIPLFEKENPQLRRFTCSVAAEVAAPLYYDIFLKMLEDADGHVRAIAATGFANIGDLRAVEPVKGLLLDMYPDVQEAAIGALGRLKDGLDINELIESLKIKNPVLRKNIALLLGVLSFAGAVPELGFALKDDSVDVRRAVVSALSSIKTGDSIKYLTLALTDEDQGIRVSAALSLGAIGSDGALEPLCLLLSDPDGMVRVAAAKALGMLGSRSAAPALIKALSDKNGFVVTTAVDSIGKLGGAEAKAALIGMLTSADKEIRRTAIKALSGFEGVEGAIVPFIEDDDWATRVAAVEALGDCRDSGVRAKLERLFDKEEDPAVIKTLERFVR